MSIAVDYRMPARYLTTVAIVSELLWIGDATNWRGSLGEYARERAETLRVELRRREWGQAHG